MKPGHKAMAALWPVYPMNSSPLLQMAWLYQAGTQPTHWALADALVAIYIMDANQ